MLRRDSNLWRAAMSGVAEDGFAVLTSVLDPARLVHLAGGDNFQRLDETLPSGVYQQYDFTHLAPDADPELHEFATTLEAVLAEAWPNPGTGKPVEFNEANVHRYARGDAGLGIHRDMPFYRMIIAGATLARGGPIHVYDAADREVVVDTHAGDLYLFRAPGLPRRRRSPRARDRHHRLPGIADAAPQRARIRRRLELNALACCRGLHNVAEPAFRDALSRPPRAGVILQTRGASSGRHRYQLA